MSGTGNATTFRLIDGALPAKARRWFCTNGYLHIRGAVDLPTCSRLALAYDEMLRILTDEDTENIWYAPAARGGKIIQRFNRLNFSSSIVKEFCASHPAMAAIAKGLLGDEAHFVTGEEGSEGAVMVTKDATNIGSGSALPWHYDGYFTKHLPMNPFINAGVYLDDSDEHGGCLIVIPGSHVTFSLPEDFEGNTQTHPAEVPVVALVGDVVVHSSQLWHCSRRRTTPNGVRRVLYANYTDHR